MHTINEAKYKYDRKIINYPSLKDDTLNAIQFNASLPMKGV